MHSDVYFAIGLLVGLVFTGAFVAILACLPDVKPRAAKDASHSQTAEGTARNDDKSSNTFIPTDEMLPSSYAPALSRIATNVWRMKKRMGDSDRTVDEVDTRRLQRHLEATIDSLREVGVQIHDLQGRRYDAGMALKVIAFEQTPGLSQDQIIDSVKPTVTWNERLIQTGEVIVGTPSAKSEPTGEQC